MILHVANPIYDSVFKYIMEDERIAKTVISALLKKEVTGVTVRPHEYSNTTRDSLSMFRIDFAARVREDDGKERVVLIELQKTWLDTETLRFRQYLGAQYSSKRNIMEGSRKGYAFPMVAVYLLGHRVGSIDEPVLYVHHKPYNYEGAVVTKGIPDPFVDSLVHDSIIVQIPLLHGQVNNRLEKVLSVFDQTKKDANDTQVLNIDETRYEGDDDMMYMLHRLTAAAADSEMRQDMNVEDEYFSAIEDRDTALMKRDKQLEEKNVQLKQKEVQIQEKEVQIQEKDAQLEQKDAQLEQKEVQIQEKDAQLEQKDAQLEQKDAQLEQKDAQLEQKDAQLRQIVASMSANGLNMDSIARLTGLTAEQTRKLLG